MIETIREKCFRVSNGRKWGIVRWTGSEWISQIAFYQSNGKPKNRRPRYKLVGFYTTLFRATSALEKIIGL